MRKGKKGKRQKASIAVLVLIGALVLTGTYAWQSISQVAKNEKVGERNPGGRLHDDWNGTKKQVYVENFTGMLSDGTTDPDAANIYVRVKLQGYMEFGDDAGTPESGTKNAKPLISGTKIDDTSNWPVLMQGKTDKLQYYLNLKMATANQTVDYLPTFNKNKESLKADINGTYEGTTAGDREHFDDYTPYVKGTTSGVTKDAYYYAKADETGALPAGFSDTGSATPDKNDGAETTHKTHNEKHEVTTTLGTEKIITMDEWLKLNDSQKKGNFWVWDSDGWAYWANPVKPGEATGPLLTEVTMKKDVEMRYYYAINVVGEFASAGDWGEDGNVKTGFYKNGVTKDAIKLLDTVADTALADSVTVTADKDEVLPGKTVNLTADVTLLGESIENQNVTWTLSGQKSSGTTLSVNGNKATLNVASDETVGTLKVKAVPEVEKDIEVTKTIKVLEPDEVEITTTGTVTKLALDEIPLVTQGTQSTVQFSASVMKDGENYGNQSVTWSISGNTSSSTTINEKGLLTIAADEGVGTNITVIATSKADGETKTSTKVCCHVLSKTILDAINDVEVTKEGVLNPDTGATATVTIDGKEFFVLAKDTKNNKALIIKKCIENTTRAFGTTPIWKDASLRTYWNNDYLDANPTLKKIAVETELTTWSAWNSTNDFSSEYKTRDKVFALSEADLYGTTNSVTAPASHYTMTKIENGVKKGILLTAPSKRWPSWWESSGNNYANQDTDFWLRSPRDSATKVAYCSYISVLIGTESTDSNGVVRPALWIQL